LHIKNIKKLKKKINAQPHWLCMIRCIFLYTFVFIANPSYGLAQNTSILIISQADSRFSTILSNNINTRIDARLNSIKIDKKNLQEQPDFDLISKYDFIITLGNKPAEYVLKKKNRTPRP